MLNSILVCTIRASAERAALRSEFSSGQKSAVDRVAALEEEVGWHMAQ